MYKLVNIYTGVVEAEFDSHAQAWEALARYPNCYILM